MGPTWQIGSYSKIMGRTKKKGLHLTKWVTLRQNGSHVATHLRESRSQLEIWL